MAYKKGKTIMPLFGPNIKRMEQRGDIEGLVKELKNRGPKVRTEATKALSELKHVGGLIEASKNDNSEVRFEAVSALENVDETEAALAAIIDVLTTDENETGYKLLDAYLILNMRGSAMDGTPLERRGKLLGYAAQREQKRIAYMHSGKRKICDIVA